MPEYMFRVIADESYSEITSDWKGDVVDLEISNGRGWGYTNSYIKTFEDNMENI